MTQDTTPTERALTAAELLREVGTRLYDAKHGHHTITDLYVWFNEALPRLDAERAARAPDAKDATIERLTQALRVSSHSPHDQAGEPVEGFPVCSVCGAIQTRAARAPEGEPETAWLIERGQPEGQDPTVWWTGNDDWTTDANKAQRFFSRDAAQTAIESRSGVLPRQRFIGRAVEHVWLRAARAEPGLRLQRQIADVVYELRHRKPGVTDADIAEVLERAALEAHGEPPRCPTCDSGKRSHRGFPTGGDPSFPCDDPWHGEPQAMSGWEGPLREMRRKVAEALQFPYGGPAALDIIDATIATLAAPRPDWQRGYDQGQDDFRDALDRIDAELRANPPRAALSGSTAPDAQCEFGHRPVVGLCSMGHPLIAASPDPAQGGGQG